MITIPLWAFGVLVCFSCGFLGGVFGVIILRLILWRVNKKSS